MKRVPREFIKNLIKTTEGKYFGIYFKKLNGSLKKLNGHLMKNQKLVEDKYGYITIFDRNARKNSNLTQRGEWRKVNVNRIIAFSFKGNKYKVI